MVVDFGNKIPGGGQSSEGSKDLWKAEQGKWTVRRGDHHARIREAENKARNEIAAKNERASAKQAEHVHDAKQPGAVANGLKGPHGTTAGKTSTPPETTASAHSEQGDSPDLSASTQSTRDKLAAAAKQLAALVTSARQPLKTSATSTGPATAHDLRQPADAAAAARDPRATHGASTPTAGAQPTAFAAQPTVTRRPTTGEQPADSAKKSPYPPFSKRGLPAATVARRAPFEKGGPGDLQEDTASHPTAHASSDTDTHESSQHPDTDAQSAHLVQHSATGQNAAIAGAVAQGDRRITQGTDDDDGITRIDADSLRTDDPAAVQGAGTQAGTAGATSARSGHAHHAGESLDGLAKVNAGAEEIPYDESAITKTFATPQQAAFDDARKRYATFTNDVVQPLARIASDIDHALMPIVQALSKRVDGPLKEEFLALMRGGDSPYGAGTRLA